MLKALLTSGVLSIMAVLPVFAEDCVKVRNGQEGYDCMQFSKEEMQIALKYGMRLGSPYKIVQRQLMKSGWSVDSNWLKDNATEIEKKDYPICGSGWDAVCSITFAKSDVRIDLLFSGQSGLPLIGVEKQP